MTYDPNSPTRRGIGMGAWTAIALVLAVIVISAIVWAAALTMKRTRHRIALLQAQ